jgi:hypothetical protein
MVLLGLIAVIAAVSLLQAIERWLRAPLKLIEIVLVLPGTPAIRTIDALFPRANFWSPEGRRDTLHTLLASLRTGRILDGKVVAHGASRFAGIHLSNAKAIYRDRMAAANLEETPAWEIIGSRSNDPPSPACLLGIIVTTDKTIETGGASAAKTTLVHLTPGSEGPEVLYLYYAPEPGAILTENEASALLKSITLPSEPFPMSSSI